VAIQPETVKTVVEITGSTGVFLLLPVTATPEEARLAVLQAYVGDEPDRIEARQRRNAWSYRWGVRFVHACGGRLMATPNGILAGVGGNRLLGVFSQAGGTTWGDIFLFNLTGVPDPSQTLRNIVAGGKTPKRSDPSGATPGNLGLEPLLRHEERHAAQWARYGALRFIASYLFEAIRTRGKGAENRWEIAAGLSDGGYR
jgi:hypothetical protein